MEERWSRLVDWFKNLRDEQPLLAQALVAAVVLVATVAVGAVIGTSLAVGGGGTTPTGSVVGLRPAIVGELIPAPKATPEKLEKPRGMGSKKAGISIVAESRVTSVDTGTEVRRAPEGSRMLAFKVADWACEEDPCESWGTLEPTVSIDGVESSLDEAQSTYVVVVPPGTNTIDLQIEADGFPQSLSLLDDSLGQNITLFAKEKQTEPVQIQQRFRLAERTSTPLTGPDGLPTDTFFRTVSVGTAQRHFFLDDKVPTAPENAFLIVTAAFTYDGQTQPSALDPAELTFVLPNGRVIPATDMDPDPAVVTLGFEIPAGIKQGTLTFGGDFQKQSTTGVAYTSTLETKKIKVDFSK